MQQIYYEFFIPYPMNPSFSVVCGFLDLRFSRLVYWKRCSVNSRVIGPIVIVSPDEIKYISIILVATPFVVT